MAGVDIGTRERYRKIKTIQSLYSIRWVAGWLWLEERDGDGNGDEFRGNPFRITMGFVDTLCNKDVRLSWIRCSKQV